VIWRDCRTRFGAWGPCGVALDPVCQIYGDAVLALPSFLEWQAAARQESWVITSYSNTTPGASSA
jgi:hypothetical protein